MCAVEARLTSSRYFTLIKHECRRGWSVSRKGFSEQEGLVSGQEGLVSEQEGLVSEQERLVSKLERLVSEQERLSWRDWTVNKVGCTVCTPSR